METAAHFQPPLDFSQRVKALRNRLGFSQEQFAEVFAVSSATVKLWEKGGLYPTKQDWQRIVLFEVEGVKVVISGQRCVSAVSSTLKNRGGNATARDQKANVHRL